ncbi:hypothetical protein QTP86_007519 [Hemibagrus guttatus]|nr:hypothetical protein QTP86_007519 [Hemibagrus guttatus]
MPILTPACRITKLLFIDHSAYSRNRYCTFNNTTDLTASVKPNRGPTGGVPGLHHLQDRLVGHFFTDGPLAKGPRFTWLHIHDSQVSWRCKELNVLLIVYTFPSCPISGESPEPTTTTHILRKYLDQQDNKLDYIQVQRTPPREFRDCFIFVFTETWLSSRVPDATIQLEELTLFCADRNAALCNALNDFYARFDVENNIASKNIPLTRCSAYPWLKRTLCRVNPQKYAGPNNIPGRVLRECAEQLVDVFTDTFNISLSSAIVPTCLKTMTIVPVPKKSTVSCLDDYHPIALTPIVMKSFQTQLLPSLDPLQFVYHPTHSTEDAITIILYLPLQLDPRPPDWETSVSLDCEQHLQHQHTEH